MNKINKSVIHMYFNKNLLNLDVTRLLEHPVHKAFKFKKYLLKLKKKSINHVLNNLATYRQTRSKIFS